MEWLLSKSHDVSGMRQHDRLLRRIVAAPLPILSVICSVESSMPQAVAPPARIASNSSTADARTAASSPPIACSCCTGR
jgi:hypothetical protein